ncbi:MAG: FkbM family methyltransferase [Candidatus Freyarchaeota archaeon]|nr:FkbM family methyltransferase [Candidatus Jordarchaeia archaeon]
MVLRQSSANEYLSLGPTHGYLLKSYVMILLAVIRRVSSTRKDLSGLLFMLYSPFLYLLGVKSIRSPLGFVYATDRETLRSFAYGFFKTHFFYLKDLEKLLGKLHFSVVVDVGANIGDFTLGAANTAEKIVAVEPAKRNFRMLEANVRANNLCNVVLVNAAATDNEKDIYLQGNASDMFVVEDEGGELVKGLPLDAIAELYGIENIEVLKVDVQGHEQSALLGIHNLLLKKAVKMFIIEVHIKRKVRVEDVVSFMEEHGYRLIYKDNYLFSQPHLYFTPSQTSRCNI